MRPDASMEHTGAVQRDEQQHSHSPTELMGRPNNRYLLKLGAVALVVAASLPFFQQPILADNIAAPGIGVDSRAVPHERKMVFESDILRRADSPTDVCTRWSHQSAIINGTLYVYGGMATTQTGQTANKWSKSILFNCREQSLTTSFADNDFLSMNLNQDWQISTPSLTGLPQPSGPPNVSNGFLWNSHESLFLYGGEFSDNPVEAPTAFSMWEYSALSSQWIEHSNPKTSAGSKSTSDNQPVQRAAEGAGASVAGLGRGWYFGGHEDTHTTEGWSTQVARIYIKSLIEFTFPGYQNTQVNSLADKKPSGSDGTWRNITDGGTQSSAGFPERADGLLLYIPGFGAEGLLIGLAGGTADSFVCHMSQSLLIMLANLIRLK
jgi:hypothetical protein